MSLADQVVSHARAWVGRDYKPGQTERCADFVRHVLDEVGIDPPVTRHPSDGLPTGPLYASSFAGDDVGALVSSAAALQPGDIVLLKDTYGDFPPGTITHVGIYVGGGMIVDRPTASKPVQHRALAVFGGNFREGRRLLAYSSSASPAVVPSLRNVTRAQLQAQLHDARANGLATVLAAAAKKHQVDPAFVLAVASRETNIRNVIGDSGHGVGVMQVDDQHEVAAAAKADGSWQTHPERLVDFAVRMLRDNLAWAHRMWPSYDSAKIAAAAYNSGQSGAQKGIVDGAVDAYTTGKDYGADVVARRAVFADLLAGPSAPTVKDSLTIPSSDRVPDSPATDAMRALFAKGIMDPNPEYDDGLDPLLPVKRGELALVVARVLAHIETKGTPP